jgi:hypothetical protein
MAVGNILCTPSTILLQGGSSGNIAVDPDCCCDPCGCVPGYATEQMPATMYIATPFGSMTATRNASQPNNFGCVGRCIDFSGIKYIIWSCNYSFSLTDCDYERWPTNENCDGPYDVVPTPCVPCFPIRRFTEAIGDAIPLINTTLGGGYTIYRRVRCDTGEWSFRVVFEYNFTQLLTLWFEGTYQGIVYNTVADPPCPASCSGNLITNINLGRSWCSPGSPATVTFSPTDYDAGIPPVGAKGGRGNVYIDTGYVVAVDGTTVPAFTPNLRAVGFPAAAFIALKPPGDGNVFWECIDTDSSTSQNWVLQQANYFGFGPNTAVAIDVVLSALAGSPVPFPGHSITY